MLLYSFYDYISLSISSTTPNCYNTFEICNCRINICISTTRRSKEHSNNFIYYFSDQFLPYFWLLLRPLSHYIFFSNYLSILKSHHKIPDKYCQKLGMVLLHPDPGMEHLLHKSGVIQLLNVISGFVNHHVLVVILTTQSYITSLPLFHIKNKTRHAIAFTKIGLSKWNKHLMY